MAPRKSYRKYSRDLSTTRSYQSSCIIISASAKSVSYILFLSLSATPPRPSLSLPFYPAVRLLTFHVIAARPPWFPHPDSHSDLPSPVLKRSIDDESAW